MKNKITKDEILRHLRYDPSTGIFLRNKRPPNDFTSIRIANSWNSRYADKPAGTVNSAGYVSIIINYNQYYAHRLAFVIMTGEWPEYEIDHINTIESDNRWENLRAATSAQNKHNTKNRTTSISGFKGVSFDKRSQKWRACITINKKLNDLGLFLEKESAYLAYCNAAEKYFGEFARLA
ncbi:MAG: hypothetical protein B7Z19_03105 [Polynucleobacter sp. 32-46-5]|nr:MAG: hypothetical protein B7Z19_03105 [Polynucleobacter sp. 32-46-5]